MVKCLVRNTKGYHVFCDWRQKECLHWNKESQFVNHCKYCFIGMVKEIQEPWANEEGIPMINPFKNFLCSKE